MSNDWNADAYKVNAAFVPALASEVLKMLDAQPGERILDIGCGEGTLTHRFAKSKEEDGFGCIDVVGIDSSPDMIKNANERFKDTKFIVADGQNDETYLEFEGQFDARDPEAVIRGARRSLKIGGRFVGEMGGALNIASVHGALLTAARRRGHDHSISPWFFPTAREYKELLEANGFKNVSTELVPRQTILPGGLRDWLETLATPYFSHFSPDVQEAIKVEVCENLKPVLCDKWGVWMLDYVRLRFHATAV
ncbi:S-adenosyl-L-methionine-dependent methyltransferase [Chytridium lagenaria]|nr:S-adenosyl-L-methionine-dependent methyltransferase [Chytridium lagenaria]